MFDLLRLCGRCRAHILSTQENPDYSRVPRVLERREPLRYRDFASKAVIFFQHLFVHSPLAEHGVDQNGELSSCFIGTKDSIPHRMNTGHFRRRGTTPAIGSDPNLRTGHALYRGLWTLVSVCDCLGYMNWSHYPQQGKGRAFESQHM